MGRSGWSSDGGGGDIRLDDGADIHAVALRHPGVGDAPAADEEVEVVRPAAEATVGLALVIAIIRTRQTPEVDEYSDLKE